MTVTACGYCRVMAPRSKITGACDPYMHAPGGDKDHEPFRPGKTRRKRQARETRRK